MDLKFSLKFLAFMLIAFLPFSVLHSQCDSNTDLVIDTDQTILDQSMIIDGDLTILPDVTLTIDNSTLKFTPGHGIIVQDSATLFVVNGSQLTDTICNQEEGWNGIYAVGSSYTEMNYSQVSNAIVGYHSEGGTGNIFQSKGTFFVNNETGVVIENSVGEIYYYMIGNYFSSIGEPGNSQDGIHITNVTLNDATHYGGDHVSIWKNRFVGCWNGIRLVNIKGEIPLKVRGNVFTDVENIGIRYLNNLTGTDLQSVAPINFLYNAMYNVPKGILNTRSRGDLVGNVFNDFTNFGIRLDLPFYYKIALNDFVSNQVAPYSKGVYLNQSTSLENPGPFPFPANCEVTDNSFNLSTAGLYFLDYRTDQHAVTVNCNSFRSNGKAIQIQSDNVAPIIPSKINVLGTFNTFLGNGDDFHVGFNTSLDGYKYPVCTAINCDDMMPMWPPSGPGAPGMLTSVNYDSDEPPCANGQRVAKETTTVKSFNVELSPNPTSGKLNLDFSGLDNQNARISITDAMGKQVELLYEGKLNNSNMSLQLDKLPNGLYFIVIRTSEESLVKKLLIAN